MNSQDNFTIVYEEISKLKVETGNLENNIEYQIFKNQTDYFESIINANRQQYTPDFNLGYFYGSNNYPNSKTYNGFTIGIDIPLFWSEQKANTNVAKISYQINQNQFEDNLFMLNSKQKQLLIELENYTELIRKYEESGSNLSDQIILSAQKSFEAGEIDYFKFVNSMDNALNSLLYHYENIAKHNKTIIELKFLTI
jgi:cobalt-zinc-cadmium resistance protein CzcA